MSRSRRHHPVRQMCSDGQKSWRTAYNRALRHKNKILTEKGCAEHTPVRGEEQSEDGPQYGWDDQIWMDVQDVSDVWTSPSDGWIACWNSWSERRKLNPFSGWSSYRNQPDRIEFLKARWKRIVWNK